MLRNGLRCFHSGESQRFSPRCGKFEEPRSKRKCLGNNGEPDRTRTCNPLINPGTLCSWLFKHFPVSRGMVFHGVRGRFVPKLVPGLTATSPSPRKTHSHVSRLQAVPVLCLIFSDATLQKSSHKRDVLISSKTTSLDPCYEFAREAGMILDYEN